MLRKSSGDNNSFTLNRMVPTKVQQQYYLYYIYSVEYVDNSEFEVRLDNEDRKAFVIP